MNYLKHNSFKQICRICLSSKNKMESIFQNTVNSNLEYHKSFVDMVNFFASIQISFNDGLPQLICTDCINRLSECCQFKKLCENSDKILHHLVNETESCRNFIVNPEFPNYGLLSEELPIQRSEREVESSEMFKLQYVEDKSENKIRQSISFDIIETAQSPAVVEKKFECDKCHKKFSSISTLSRHKGIHLESLSHMCANCGRCFRRKDDLHRHMRIHTLERPYQCSECPKTFSQSFQMKEHLRAHLNQKQFRCGVCSKGFSRHISHVKHMKTHDKLKRQVMCDLCGKQYSGPRALSMHKKTHLLIKSFECPHCDQTFRQAEHMKVHIMRRHDNEKPYKCSKCELGYVTSSKLKIHLRKHLSKEHVCNVCGFACDTLKQLNRHIDAHSKEKPFKCGLCSKSYLRSQALGRHLNSHYSIKVPAENEPNIQ